jgi:hypothetical protein
MKKKELLAMNYDSEESISNFLYVFWEKYKQQCLDNSIGVDSCFVLEELSTLEATFFTNNIFNFDNWKFFSRLMSENEILEKGVEEIIEGKIAEINGNTFRIQSPKPKNQGEDGGVKI